jgi:K+-sensing histidine kinase KdpD
MATAHAMDCPATDRDTWPKRHESALLPAVSRALRTSLHAIVGFAELLRDSNLTAEEREEFTAHIGAEAERLLRRVEGDLLGGAMGEDAVLTPRRPIARRSRLRAERDLPSHVARTR